MALKMVTFRPFDNASGDAPMSRRRLRLPAIIALLAVAAPVLATQPDSDSSGTTTASIRSHARQFGATVKQGSTEFGRRVAHGAREAGQQFNADMHQFGHHVHYWWDGVRSSVAGG
jgi:hypothetical protein